MKIIKFTDTHNYMFYISDKTDHTATQSISTKSTSITMTYDKERIYVFDILIGTKYIDDSFDNESIQIFQEDDKYIINFTELEIDLVEDPFEGENEKDINEKVKVYLVNWHIAKIEIFMDFLNSSVIYKENIIFEER